MSGRKRKRTRGPRDLFSVGRRKGTDMTITVDAELLKILDAFRSDVEEQTGVELQRRPVLEGLLRRVWRDKLIEAAALGATSATPIVDQLRAHGAK